MAIVSKTVEQAGKTFIVTTSSLGNYIINENGEKYEEAWDLPDVVHTYTETDEPVNMDDDMEAIYAEAGRIMLGVGE